MTVTWQDNSNNETGFALYREGGSSVLEGQAATKIKDLPADTTSFVDTEVSLETDYSYSVVATGNEGDSGQVTTKTVAKIAQGVDLMVGTNNRHWDAVNNGTIFRMYLLFPESVLQDPDVEMTAKLTGPEGWNDGEAFEDEYFIDGFERENGYAFVSLNGTDAINGTYTFELTVDGKPYTASAVLNDASYRLPRATNVKVTSSSNTSVSASWDTVPGAAVYFASLWIGDYEGNPVVNYTRANGTSITFDGLDLTNDKYQIEVVAQSADVIKVENFGLSYITAKFAIGLVNDACSSNDQNINVPDANLREAIRSSLNISSDTLTCVDMASLIEIEENDGVDKGISSLEGLQYAIYLQDAQLWDNAVTDASPLADLENIEWLNLNKNQISDLTPFQNLTSLRGLFLCCESNTYTDIAPLANLTTLERLDIGGHQLGDVSLSVLTNLSSLEYLWTWDNAINDPSFLTQLENIVFLELGGNEIEDISFVDQLPKLEGIVLGYNPITDLTPIFDETQLTELDLENFELVYIDFLRTFTQLQILDLANNNIDDLTPLVENTGLGDGDFIRLDANLLDVTDGSDDKAAIDALIARGVEVTFEDQKTE
jgi:Leucine-rich repeat (LRR) protein